MRVAVTGGSGFVGSHLVPALLRAGHEIRVVGRGLRPTTLPEGMELTYGDVVTGEGLTEAFMGAEVVINLVAVIRERGVQTFEAVNAEGTRKVVKAAEAAAVRRVIQLSAIGADPDPHFPYLRSKWQGEQHVMATHLDWVILRSSVMFGPGDGFFAQLATSVRMPSPFLPVPGDGSAVFQPISVDDVARCLVMVLADQRRSRTIYELGGPEQFTLTQLTEELARVTGKEWFGISRRKVMRVDVRMIRPAAVMMDKVMSRPLVTPSQLALLAVPNVTDVDAVERDFGFTPQSIHGNLDYLKRHPWWWRFESLRNFL